MVAGLNEEFYEHLHALDDRYGYALERESGEHCWVYDAPDDDPDLLFCQKYVQDRFPVTPWWSEVEDRFEDVFYEMVTTGPTTVAAIARAAKCTTSIARKIIQSHKLKAVYDKYQGFFNSTVIHNHKTGEDIIALKIKDVLEYCGYKETNRPNVSRAKSIGLTLGHFSFMPMEKYLRYNSVDKSKVEELYEQRITKVA